MARPEALAALDACRARGLTLGTAESCTGGMIAEWLTDVAGSSEVVRGAIVSYADEVKVDVLGVSKGTLDAYGAVSAETALEMAMGASRVLSTDMVVAVTGVAGPDGGSDQKPVGRVELCAIGPQGQLARQLNLDGGRAAIREQAARAALELVVTLLTES